MNNCGNGLVLVGGILLLLALVGYLYKNPQVLGGLADRLRLAQGKIQAAKNASGSPQTVATSVRPRSDDLTPTEQFEDLHAGEFVEFTDVADGQTTEYEVTGTGRHQAQNRQGKDFTPRGEEYPMYVLDGERMLFERPDGWYVFNRYDVLIGEEARAFDAAGEAFSKAGQIARGHSFTWKGKKLTILDVGYTIYQHGGGKSHLSDAAMNKYMLAELADGSVVYLENLKVGQDRVWYGKSLGQDLKPYVGRVLRAAA